MTDRLPFFVYGTLRTGQGNWSWALQDYTTSEERAFLDGGRMYSNGGFPYVILDAEGGQIVGDLMHVPAGRYDQVMHNLDRLEGYRGANSSGNHYERVIVTVTTEDGREITAYTYVAQGRVAQDVQRNLALIESGDWIERQERVGAFA